MMNGTIRRRRTHERMAVMAALMKEDTERWRGVIRAAGLKPE